MTSSCDSTEQVAPPWRVGQVPFDALGVVGTFLASERVQTESGRRWGLYATWKLYIDPLATLTHALVDACVNDVIRRAGNGALTSDDAVEHLLCCISMAYAPWIEPFDVMGHLTSPWLEHDSALAEVWLRFWVRSIVAAQKIDAVVTQSPSQFLNRLWQLYTDKFTHRSLQESVASLVHTHLNSAPWHDFTPSLDDLNNFIKVNYALCLRNIG